MKQHEQARIKYLDGLRAVAVLAVLVYHNDNDWLPGGYLGVEVFFVISGFIITQLLYREWQQSGNIKLWQFYHRRWMRLFPVLLVVVLAAWVSILILHPEDIMKILTDLPYSLSFTANLDYILNERSYFNTSGRPRLLEHLWSLGIEFQFYIFWPVMCLWFFRQRTYVMTSLITLFALCGYAWMAYLYLPDEDPSRVYFGTDTRIGALLIGASIALFTEQYQQHIKYQHTNKIILGYQWVFALLGMFLFTTLLILFYLLTSTSSTPFYGGLGLTALVTGLIIFYCHNIALTTWHPLVLMLNNQQMSWLGLRSYGIYLWHWPIFCLTQPGVDINFEGFYIFGLRFVATLLCAEITYRLVELPFRKGLLGHIWNWFSSTNRYKHNETELSNHTEESAVFPLVRYTDACKDRNIGCWILAYTHMVADRFQIATKAVVVFIMVVALYALYATTVTAKINLALNPESIVDPPAAIPASDIPPLPSIHTTQMDGKPSPVQQDEKLPKSTKPARPPLVQQVSYDKDPSNGYIKRVRVSTGGSPLILGLGDSVMIGAYSELMRQIPGLAFDAKVGRKMNDTLKLLTNEYKPMPGSVIIIHLGNNGLLDMKMLEKVVKQVGSDSRIVFINLKLPLNYAQANNRILEDVRKAYGNVEIIDWLSNSKNDSSNFAKDGMHLTSTGAKLYARLIGEVLCPKSSQQLLEICAPPQPDTTTAAALPDTSFNGKNVVNASTRSTHSRLASRVTAGRKPKKNRRNRRQGTR